MKVLIITSQWPSPESPEKVPFLVQQVRYLRRSGVEVSVFAFRGHKNPANYLSARIKLRRNFDLSKFDLIHAHFGPSGLLALPRQRPLVVTFHGSDLQGIVGEDGRYRRHRGLSFICNAIARLADERIIVASHLKHYLPRNLHVNLVPGGVDLEQFHASPQTEARRKLGLSEKGLLVLFAADPGRSVKRYSLAQAAVSLLPEHCRAELLTIAAVPHSQVSVYMNACDALLLTSKHEGSPTTVKEAIACNLPVVSVDVGDVRQRFADVPGCRICEDDSPQSICNTLAEVLQSPRHQPDQQRIQELDEQLAVQRLIAVYERALKRFRTGSRRSSFSPMELNRDIG